MKVGDKIISIIDRLGIHPGEELTVHSVEDDAGFMVHREIFGLAWYGFDKENIHWRYKKVKKIVG